MYGKLISSALVGVAMLLMCPGSVVGAADSQPQHEETRLQLLFYAKARYAYSNYEAALANPHIAGAFFQVIWSEVEKEPGKPDWSALDRWMAPWLEAGKKVAIRIMWSTSGYWPEPYYKTPTPKWVWEAGAKYAFHAPSGTEIPLAWDPIYQQHALRFLEQFAARYAKLPGLLFVDVTPGAETNPYRFGTIQRITPEFADEFQRIPASDGRSYSDALWVATVKEWVDAAAKTLADTPRLVTLNTGGLPGVSHTAEIGDYCVARGFYVGQNGLKGTSYSATGAESASPFHRWSKETKLFFEMVMQSGGRTGSLLEVMEAADRIDASYLNVYPEDVLRGSPGYPKYDPEFEKALAHGASLAVP